MSLAENAMVYFQNGQYEEATEAYKLLGQLLGIDMVAANIELCKRRRINRFGETQSPQSINIVFVSDENYAMPTYVAIHSLIKGKKSQLPMRIFLASSGMSSASKDAVSKLEGEGIKIVIVDVAGKRSELKLLKEGFHVSPAATIKFSLPEILGDIDKVIYIDGDVIVRGDLSDLFAVSLDGAYVAAVKDIKPVLKYKPSILIKLNIPHHRNYFNSGMMVMDLKAMRRDGISKRLMDYRRDGINSFMDQDALNVVFGDRVKYLPCRYNFMTTLIEEFSIDEIRQHYSVKAHIGTEGALLKSADVLHYTSKRKPWNGVMEAPHFYMWYRNYISSRAHEIRDFPDVCDMRQSNVRQLIVSLTTFPARIQTVHRTISSILAQSLPPRGIVLWLTNEEFPQGEVGLPVELLALKNHGLTIKWCRNCRSYNKLIPSLREFPSDFVVTVDDDIVYKPTMLEQLVASYLQYPGAIHCSRGHRAQFDATGAFVSYRDWQRQVKDGDKPSYANFLTGVGGVLYPPSVLDKEVFNEDLFTKICRTGDDIWFWFMAVRNGTKIRVVPDSDFKLDFTPDSQEVGLCKQNDHGGKNDEMLREMLMRFPEVRERVVGELK